jgi:glutathione S-transferase
LQSIAFDCDEIHDAIGETSNHHALGIAGGHEAAACRCRAALAVLDQRRSDRTWLALERTSLADIACYTLVAVADQGDAAAGIQGG